MQIRHPSLLTFLNGLCGGRCSEINLSERFQLVQKVLKARYDAQFRVHQLIKLLVAPGMACQLQTYVGQGLFRQVFHVHIPFRGAGSTPRNDVTPSPNNEGFGRLIGKDFSAVFCQQHRV